MFTVTSLGKRPEYLGNGQYDAFEILHEAADGDAWPTGPVFPEGHLFEDEDGSVYEVVVPKTIRRRTRDNYTGYTFTHQYICRPADKRDT